MKSMLAALAALVLATSAQAQPRNADEKAIYDQVAKWNQLMAAKDVDGVVKLYAADGMIMPTNAPAQKGHAALKGVWTGLLGAPGIKATLTPVEVTVAGSKDLAIEHGHYAITTTGQSGPSTEKGKYIVVWKKAGGDWKVAYDIFNPDGAAQPAS